MKFRRSVVLTLLLLMSAGSKISFGAVIGTVSENDPTGVYKCKGTNPDKSVYEGFVEIVKRNDVYMVRWTMLDGSQVIGVGILHDKMLSVSYYGGQASLVVYTKKPDGNLKGEWTALSAEGEIFPETLTRTEEKPPVHQNTPRPSRPKIVNPTV